MATNEHPDNVNTPWFTSIATHMGRFDLMYAMLMYLIVMLALIISEDCSGTKHDNMPKRQSVEVIGDE